MPVNRHGDIDLQPLLTFHVTASSATFTEAAERLSISQSAVSHAIRKIERSIGQQLLVRDQVPIRLTDAGKALFDTCERIFLDLQRCRDQLQHDAERPLTGRLRLGAPVEFGNSVLARRIAPFLKANKGIEAGFTFSHELLKPLLADELDVIIDSRTHVRDDLMRASLFRERYVLVASPSLIKDEKIRRLSDLERVPWLTTDPSGKWWQRLLVQLPEGAELNPCRLLPVNHLRGMVQFAVAGVGVALIPAYCVLYEVRQGWLKVLFSHLQISEDRFYMYCKKMRCDNPKIQAFLSFMQQLKPEELGEISGNRKVVSSSKSA
ncbi:MAG: hypothetical protein A2W80_05015 [Candidatus Riflebacteria bacterium GWC2_50_8]|nr:MAG: hypothetical protein A2W80_05015 [Candidatus Riflebacteria bacterium GWC2_50_8]